MVGVSYSVEVGLIVYSAVCSMVYYSDLEICSAMDCSGCSSLGPDCSGYVGMVVVWADEEKNLLKIFVLRP